MVAEFRARRALVVSALNAIPGVCCPQPAGTFYAFPRVEVPGSNSVQLADQLLDQAGVVTLPGTGFGEEGEGYLRLSYANSQANLSEGLRRIAGFLAARAKR
jgi:aspartate/methionine/tyrosine aminotransferase